MGAVPTHEGFPFVGSCSQCYPAASGPQFPSLGPAPLPDPLSLCPCRLVELAPQYYLSNLPPSESRDLLMELREKVVAAEDVPEVAEPLEEAAGGEDENRDVCVLQ